MEQRVQEVQKQFPSEQMLQTALDMQGLTMDLLKTKFEKQMMEEALIRQEVVPNVKVERSGSGSFFTRNIWTSSKPRSNTRFTISSPPPCNRMRMAKLFMTPLYAKRQSV